MADMKMPRHAMPAQEPDVRNKNFSEVALGYTKEMAMEEATRCLGCPKMPCKNGCPVQINIPDFIAKVAEGDFESAYQIINKTSSLPAVCGRVCPQENQCEKYCVRGVKGEPVAIGRLERFVADWHNANATQPPEKPASNGHKVAIIGSGPAGLTCAGDLAKLGYEVTVFEALHKAGGVLVYGIPEFRLPKAIVQKEVDTLKQLGVEVAVNTVVGKTITIDELMGEMGFEAVFIGSGAGLPKFMNIPGENLQGVYSANEFLTRINLMKAYREGADTPIKHSLKVAVVGGGNVAMDAARCAKRLGADVHIVYRRSMEELPARHEEVEHAEEEGIIFDTLTNPVEILGYHNPDDKRDPKNGSVRGIRCIRMELGEPDEKGRRRPIEIPGSEFDMEMDCVIMALGTNPNPLIKNTTKGLEVNKHGGIIVDENALTSREGVYAGGDAVTGAATVILAMGAGKQAAAAIDEYLQKK
ncbi:MAG: NADPH-dependent glutamate synthase [Clostridiaceae bacterium]|nr:NADPH-dependent glutamate synthase [Clostridiaceae bacterium]